MQTPTFSTSFADMTKTFNHSFALDVPVSNSIGAFTFTSSNTSVATINPSITINALQFNGTTNYVAFNANIVELGKSSFTIECWVKTSGTNMGLLNCQDNDTTWEGGEKSFYIDGNGIPAFVGYGCGWIYSTVAVNDNAWHHIAVTWSFSGGSSGTGAIYIDGINQTSTNYSIYGQYAANTNNVGTFVFGKPNYSETTKFFNGAVCELRIWNVARSATEIYQNYRRLLVGNEIGLVAYHQFNQGISGGTNTDITTVANNDISGGYTALLSGGFVRTLTSSNWVSGVLLRPVYDVNVIGDGTTTITATQAATTLYLSRSTTATLTVTKTVPTIGVLTVPSNKTYGDTAFDLTTPSSNITSTMVITSTASVMVPPADINALVYGSAWTKLGGDIDGEAAGDESGYNIGISADGTVVAIGGRLNDGSGNLLPDSGHVRIYKYTPSKTVAVTNQNDLSFGPVGWTRLGADIDGEGNIEYSGSDIALSADGTTVAIGAHGNDGTSSSVNNNSDKGSVRVYRYDANKTIAQMDQTLPNFGPRGWSRLGEDIDGEAIADYAGLAVSLSADGTVVAIGAASNDGTGLTAGHVRVYKYTPGKGLITNDNDVSFGPVGWTRLGKDIDGEAASDENGYSVALSADGTIVAIGARYNDGSGNLLPDSGHVRVYRYTPSKTVAVTNQNDISFGPVGWTRLGADIDGEGNIEYSGWSVALSADGTTVALGAVGNDANSTSVNNNQDRGNVRVYRYDANKTSAQMNQSLSNFGPRGWSRLGEDIDGEAFSDYLGISVSLSADGNIVACGAGSSEGDLSNVLADAIYVRTGGSNWRTFIPSVMANTTSNLQFWNPDVQFNDVNVAPLNEIPEQFSYFAGYWLNAKRATNGQTFSVPAFAGQGSIGIFTFTATRSYPVTTYSGRLSSYNGNTLYTLTPQSDGISAGQNSNFGRVQVFRYNQNKTVAQTNKALAGFGPVGWERLGNDIDGEAAADESGTSVRISSDGTVVAIGAHKNDSTTGSSTDNRGHVRVYNISTTNALSYSSSNSSIADICSNILFIKGVNGSTTITASQTNNTVTGILDVSGTTYTLRYNPLTFTSTNTDVATVTSNGRVSIVGAGTTTIRANQVETRSFKSGFVSSNLVISGILPTFFGTWTITDVSFGVAPFTLSAPSSNSNGSFVYSNSTNTNVATITSGGVVTVVGAGSTTFTATQDASGIYTNQSITATLTVRPIAPTIGAFSIPEKYINDISFTLTAPSSNSSGAFTFSTDLDGSAIATVTSNGVVTLTGVAGTATITATQAASINGNYTGGSSVSASLVVVAPLSNFTVPSDKIYADAAFDLTNPTAIFSSEPFIFTSSDPTVASIGGAGGRTVTILKAGSTTITAKQVATLAHPEFTITAVLVIAKKTPVITLSAITKNYGDASFNIMPSSTNTDDVSGIFTITSRNPNIISIFDISYAAIRGVDSVLIDISQSATTNFTSGSTSVMITVNKGNPILSAFTVSTSRTYGSAPFSALSYPTSISDGAIVYSSSDSTVATMDSSGIITLLKAGYVNFIATQQATAYYNSVTKTTNTMTVNRAILPLMRSSPSDSIINKTYGDSYFNVVATNASNGGTITYETNNPSVAGIVGTATAGVISIVSVGTATITARREQTDKYTSDPISWTIQVARSTTTLTGLADLSYNVTSAPFSVSASSDSDGQITYSLQDPSSGVLTIHPTSGLVTLRAPGSAVIVASQAQGTLYLAPSSITATITVASAGNTLQGATITNTSSFASVNLEGASLAGVSITNTAFTGAKLASANLTNAVITSANFASADLSGATLSVATITGATFTSAILNNVNLTGAVLTSSVFTGSNLTGAKLTGVDASGASFANAKLTNTDMTGANITNVNFTNTSIKGANISDVSFSPLQKLQLLKNSDNRDIGQIIIPAVTGTTILAAISETSALRNIENLDLTSATVAVVIPTTSTSPTDVLPDVVLNVTDNDKFYLPINESEFFQIEGVKYFSSEGVVRNYLTNAIVEVINYNGTPVWLLAGSIVGLVLQTNTLNSSSFVVPTRMLITNTTPFMPTTLPTSNHSETPIIYSSSNTNIATIDASSGEITLTGTSTGFVHFTATQIQSATYEPGIAISNTLFVDRAITFTLTGLNQTFDLSTLAILDASSISVITTDATAVFYVRLSDINNVFKYQSDSSDITDVGADDIKYYVFHRNWPANLKLNPSHAMMNKDESAGMFGPNENYASDKSLLKHDFIRYIALRLFNTIHGVDLIHNESELQENSVYLGETVRNNIDAILSEISTTSSNQGMSYDASGNKYLTNDASGNTNLCRELMRQIAASAPSRLYDNVANQSGLRNVPFVENDTIQYRLIIEAAEGQNLLTGVSVIPSRSYTIKLVIKNTVTSITNTNTVVSDSEMYPNSFPYSSDVVSYAPTTDSSNVYNIFSPPAPIPFARFGYKGWYYTNSVAWVSVAPTVRNHVKWLISANTASSSVGDLQYIRINLKIHNSASLAYLMIYTQAGSFRKYAIVGGNGSLVNGTLYSFYINFNSYTTEPSYIGHTNAALGYMVGSGSFANNEVITSIAIETDSNAPAGNVEFTLSSVIVGERSATTSVKSEKEHGFEAAVPLTYP